MPCVKSTRNAGTVFQPYYKVIHKCDLLCTCLSTKDAYLPGCVNIFYSQSRNALHFLIVNRKYGCWMNGWVKGGIHVIAFKHREQGIFNNLCNQYDVPEFSFSLLFTTLCKHMVFLGNAHSPHTRGIT